MPVEKKILLYKFDELPSAKAKQKAREWWLSNPEAVDLTDTCDSFRAVCEILGVQLEEKEKGIAYSLGNSQGDYVVFAGTFQPEPNALAKIKEEYPQDEYLQKIAAEVEKLYTEIDGDAWAKLRYEYRSSRIRIDSDRDLESDKWLRDNIVEPLQSWGFRQLQDEYSNQHSDEHVDEMLTVNDYTFREDGTREDA